MLPCIARLQGRDITTVPLKELDEICTELEMDIRMTLDLLKTKMETHRLLKVVIAAKTWEEA